MAKVNDSDKAAKKKVLILLTGGTLSMRSSKQGTLAPSDRLLDLEKWVPELKEVAQIEVSFLADLDSSQIKPRHWLKMAKHVKQAELSGKFQAIVILHGTDTLAYSASALAFLLPDLSLPVVVTGAQRPLAVTRSDARNNILGAVESALEGPVEVMVFFHNQALRGNRATKIAISDFDGFGSPNFPPLGTAGISWEWNKALFWPETRRPTIWPELPSSLPSAPLVLPWIPGLDFNRLLPSFKSEWAIILEAFGSGNMPIPEELRTGLLAFMDEGGLVFIKSQVNRGSVVLDAYAPGKAMKDLGIHGGRDMTREAMVTKLMVLKSLGLNNEKIKQHMIHSLAGELTETA